MELYAQDLAGNKSIIQEFQIRISSSAGPNVKLIYPSSGKVVLGNTSDVYLDAPSDAKSVLINGISALRLDDYWMATIPVTSSNSTFTVSYEVTGSNSESSYGSFSLVTKSSYGDFQPPLVTLSNLKDGDTVSSDTIVVKGSSSDETGVQLVTLNNVKALAPDSLAASKGEWECKVVLKLGLNWVMMRAYDNSLNQNESLQPIRVFLVKAPEIITLYPIIRNLNKISIKWDMSSSAQFNHYEVYSSSKSDMSDATLLTKTNDRIVVSFQMTLEKGKTLTYFAVKIVDKLGQSSMSEVKSIL